MLNMDDIKLASFGGLLIGLATTIHYLFLGKVTGFSGVYYSIVTFDKDSIIWKVSLLSGVVLSSSIMYIKYGYFQLIIPKIDQKNFYLEHRVHYLIILKKLQRLE